VHVSPHSRKRFLNDLLKKDFTGMVKNIIIYNNDII
jgi:hypothetical protein